MIHTASLVGFGSEESGEPIFAHIIVNVFLVLMSRALSLVTIHAW
jgi:hypothetical protein